MSGRLCVCWRTLRVGCCLLLGLLAACSYPSPGNEKPWIREVPNTAGALPQIGCLYVSPDAAWIVFLEEDGRGLPVGLASVEVATGRRVEHDIGLAPCLDEKALPYDPLVGVLSAGGRTTGWENGVLYIRNPAGARSALVVVDTVRAVGCAPQLPDHPMNVDGPAWGHWCNELARRREYIGHDANCDVSRAWKYTASWRGGRYVDRTYCYDAKRRAVVAYEPGRTGQTVVELPRSGGFREVDLAAMRVSPDGRFLAYVLGYRSGFVPSPYMADVMFVMDFETGTSRALCSFGSIGGFYWTPDSWTLFVGGGGAVFTLDLSIAFPSTR